MNVQPRQGVVAEKQRFRVAVILFSLSSPLYLYIIFYLSAFAPLREPALNPLFKTAAHTPAQSPAILPLSFFHPDLWLTGSVHLFCRLKVFDRFRSLSEP